MGFKEVLNITKDFISERKEEIGVGATVGIAGALITKYVKDKKEEDSKKEDVDNGGK